MLMAQFSVRDLEILEEILYSSLTIPLSKLAKNTNATEEELSPILERLSHAGLLTVQKEVLFVDKEMRKYYESQVMKFDEDFLPGMEFLQGLLRKVPIHILPLWYSISRTSDNIFDSIVEKYLQTPLIFQRYLMELSSGEQEFSAIMRDVYEAPDFKVYSSDLIQKYNLSRQQFEECMLHLEFNFVCCLAYEKEDDHWVEIVTPFREWRDYLCFLRDTTPQPIKELFEIQRKRPQDFAFIQDMSAILHLAKKQSLCLKKESSGKWMPDEKALAAIASKCEGLEEGSTTFLSYVEQLLAKLLLLKLADVSEGTLRPLDAANEWLDQRIENRALYVYRHPLNRLSLEGVSPSLCNEKTIREAERSVHRALYSGWVYFDEFLKGVIVPLNEESVVTLKRSGRSWKYALPEYSEEEKILIKETIFRWLFEVGIVAIGTHEGRDCFCVTAFGRSLFGN